MNKIIKKSNYLDKDPNILYYNENSKTKSPIIGLLKNGNSPHLKTLVLLIAYTERKTIGKMNKVFCSTFNHEICTQITRILLI